MRVYRILALGLAFCLLLCGCGPAATPTSQPTTQPTSNPTTQPTHTTGYYLTGLNVNFGDYFVTEVTVTYESDRLTETYTVDGTTYQTTYDFSGRLLRQRMDSESYWSEEVFTYSALSDKPATEVFTRDGFSRTISRTFDEKGNTLTTHYEDTDGSWNTYTYTYDDENRQLTEKYVSAGGSDTLLTYTYNENGQITAELSLSKGKKSREVLRTYDAKGLLTRETVCRFNSNSSVNYSSETNFTYDENGNMLSQHQADHEGYWSKIESTYSATGKLLTQLRTDFAGDAFETRHTYDEKDNLIATVEGSKGNNYGFAYEYDFFGRLHKRTVTDPAGTVTETVCYTYDAKGNRLEMLTTYADGSTEKDVRTYDENGNLLTYTGYNNDTVHSSCSYTYAAAQIRREQQATLTALMGKAFVDFWP